MMALGIIRRYVIFDLSVVGYLISVLLIVVGCLPKFNSIFFGKEPLRLAHPKKNLLIFNIPKMESCLRTSLLPTSSKIWANVIGRSLWDKSVMVLGACYNIKQKQKQNNIIVVSSSFGLVPKTEVQLFWSTSLASYHLSSELGI
jgi:hypothetical protein